MIDLDDIEAARRRLQGVVHPTPTALSASLTRVCGRPVFTKPEHLQRTGSFKIRGAYNRIALLAEQSPATEVVAASAGNHAQGVALAASLCGLTSRIFMPNGASLPKVEATRAYGAEVAFAGDTIDDAIVAARAYAADRGACYVPPFDDPYVLAGQGTVGLEILEEAPGPETIVVPVGGGGLIAGIATAVAGREKPRRVIGVEAAGAAPMVAALAHGGPVTLETIDTVADGIAVRAVSALTYEHVRAHVDDIVLVDDGEISRAVLVLLERSKWVVEPAGAAGLAAVLAGRVPGDGPVTVVISGGNVDPLLLIRVIEHGLSAAGRYLRLRVVVPDRPGSLARLTVALSELDLNLVTVDHRRSGAGIGVTEVEVVVTLETRDPAQRDTVVPRLQAMGFRAELQH